MRTLLIAALALATLIVVGCQSSNPSASSAPSIQSLVGTWELTEIMGEGVRASLPDGTRLPSLDITADGRISGFAGINRINTSIDLDALRSGDLQVAPTAMTMMAGPPQLMELERRFVDALTNADQVRIDGDTLHFNDAGTPMLTFTRGS